MQLNASYQADFFDNGLKTSMTFQKDASAQAANIGLSYWGQSSSLFSSQSSSQADFQLGHFMSNQRFNANFGYLNRELVSDQLSLYSFSGETALVFADFNFAISKPIQDSFVMVAKDKSLKSMMRMLEQMAMLLIFLDQRYYRIFVTELNLRLSLIYQHFQLGQSINDCMRIGQLILPVI